MSFGEREAAAGLHRASLRTVGDKRVIRSDKPFISDGDVLLWLLPVRDRVRLLHARHTSTSDCRTSPRLSRGAGARPPRHALLLLLQYRDDLPFAEPAAPQLGPSPSRRTLLKIRANFRGASAVRVVALQWPLRRIGGRNNFPPIRP